MAGRPPIKKAPEFGKRLSQARQARGLTQSQLAGVVGVSQKMIDYYERRAVNVRSDMVCRLAEALEIPVEELLGMPPSKRTKAGRKPKLQKQFERVAELPKRDQVLVSQLLNRFLEDYQK